jgi:hypothetical protein
MKPDIIYVLLTLTVVTVVLAAAMAQTFGYLFRSAVEVHELSRREAWKAEILRACQRR